MCSEARYNKGEWAKYNLIVAFIITTQQQQQQKKHEIGLQVISTEILARIIAGKGFKHLEKHKLWGEKRERERGRKECMPGNGEIEKEKPNTCVSVLHILRVRNLRQDTDHVETVT